MDAKVLIVDDSVANLIILEDYLSEFNNEIITAENGEVAYRHSVSRFVFRSVQPLFCGLTR